MVLLALKTFPESGTLLGVANKAVIFKSPAHFIFYLPVKNTASKTHLLLTKHTAIVLLGAGLLRIRVELGRVPSTEPASCTGGDHKRSECSSP